MTEPSPLTAFLLTVLSSLIAPSLADPNQARLAAQEAIAAHNGGHDPLTTVPILAFAFTALDTLRLSMPPDLSLSMKLKLRANANALNRSARDNTDRARRIAETREPNPAEQAAIMGSQPLETAAAIQPQDRSDWAGAMKTVASRLQAATASPAQRTVNAMWAETLTNVGTEIAQGKHPRGNRANLLRTTLMANGPTFPSRA
jgi:hypothetical protein